MTRSDIISKVRAILNEAGEAKTLKLLSEDTLQVDRYIESVIPDAVNYLGRNAPLAYLQPISREVVMSQDKICSTVIVPADFLRLASIKLTNWKRAVFSVFPIGSEQYNIQHNVHTTAGENKPVCVFVSNTQIECFPAGGVEYFRYVPVANQWDSKEDSISQELFVPLCYICASLVYEIFENKPTADSMKAIAVSFFQQ